MVIILLFNYHIVIKKLKKKFFGDRFKIKEIRYVCNAYTCDDAH